jgi:hypothetical protein
VSERLVFERLNVVALSAISMIAWSPVGRRPAADTAAGVVFVLASPE